MKAIFCSAMVKFSTGFVIFLPISILLLSNRGEFLECFFATESTIFVRATEVVNGMPSQATGKGGVNTEWNR